MIVSLRLKSVLTLCAVLKVFVQQRPPVDNHQAVGVVLSTGHAHQLTGGDELADGDVRAALNTLTAVIGELHGLLIEINGVAVDTQHARRTDDIVVETLLLEGVVLGNTSLVDKIHGLVNGVLNILLIRGKGEEEVVEGVDMALCLDLKGLLHRVTLHKDGNVAVKDIHVLVGIINHTAGNNDAAKADDDAGSDNQQADDRH